MALTPTIARYSREHNGANVLTLGATLLTDEGRKTVLVAGVIAGALYNPWTGTKTRDWLTGIIAGDDDLQPLEDLERAPEPVVAGVVGNGTGD